MTRLTLPQQRAQETRQRILGAAARVFARRGYGQATVEDIATEAGVSNGALYHHFASKQELFRAILDDHLREQHVEIAALLPASSFREAIERFVAYWFDHLQSDHESDRLFMEFWAQATREPEARDALAAFARQGTHLVCEALRISQSAGAVRADLDVEAAATLIYATMEGLFLLWMVDSERIDFGRLSRPWADLIERFTSGEGEGDMHKLQEGLTVLSRQLEEGQAASATDK